MHVCLTLVTRLSADDGSIVDFDASACRHLVKYDVDGEQRWHCLEQDEQGGQLRWLTDVSSHKHGPGEHKSPTAALTPRGKTAAKKQARTPALGAAPPAKLVKVAEKAEKARKAAVRAAEKAERIAAKEMARAEKQAEKAEKAAKAAERLTAHKAAVNTMKVEGDAVQTPKQKERVGKHIRRQNATAGSPRKKPHKPGGRASILCHNAPDCLPLEGLANGGVGAVRACPGCERGFCEVCTNLSLDFDDGGQCAHCRLYMCSPCFEHARLQLALINHEPPSQIDNDEVVCSRCNPVAPLDADAMLGMHRVLSEVTEVVSQDDADDVQMWLPACD